MVAILGANSVSGEYEVSNSLRFNDNDSPRLSRTFSSEGNKKTWSYSTWFKRGNLKSSGVNTLISAGAVSGTNGTGITTNNDTIRLIHDAGTPFFTFQSSLVLRDVSAWYHLLVTCDTTDATASERIKFYLNGNNITSDMSYNNGSAPSQNSDLFFNDDVSMNIGARSHHNDLFFDGYMAETHLIDGTVKAPTDFGEFNSNAVWIPKKYSGTYGTNGFYLEFKQTGTSQNSSGIGADTSGNDHHFSTTNLTSLDITTDTCTNNFATLNFLDGSYDNNLREANLTLDTQGGGSDIFGRGTIGFSQGKWYWEVKSIINGGHGNRKIVGVVDTETPVAHPRTVTSNPYTGVIVDLFDGDVFRNASGVSDAGTFATNDIVGILFDADNGLLRLQQNGSNLFSGNAVTTNAIDTTIFYLPYIAQDGGGTNNGQLFVNFGNPTFSISSGNSDANGHGNFEYAVPSGYFSICSKNLAEFG